MNTNLSILALIEIVSALFTGVAILFITYKLLKLLVEKKIGLKTNNTASRIFMAGILFAVGHMISGVIEPILTSFRILSVNADKMPLIFQFLGYATIYVFIAYVSSILISLLGISFYNWLTPIDEFKEIKKDNIGVAIISSVIIITLSMMSKAGVVLLIESIMPYPSIPAL